MRKLKYGNYAYNEIQEVIETLEKNAPKKAKEFLTKLKEALKNIQAFSFGKKSENGKFWEVSITKDYSLLYVEKITENAKEVIITNIWVTRKDPRKKYK